MKRTGTLTLQEIFNRNTVANMVHEEIYHVLLANQAREEPAEIKKDKEISTSSTPLPLKITTSTS